MTEYSKLAKDNEEVSSRRGKGELFFNMIEEYCKDILSPNNCLIYIHMENII